MYKFLLVICIFFISIGCQKKGEGGGDVLENNGSTPPTSPHGGLPPSPNPNKDDLSKKGFDVTKIDEPTAKKIRKHLDDNSGDEADLKEYSQYTDDSYNDTIQQILSDYKALRDDIRAKLPDVGLDNVKAIRDLKKLGDNIDELETLYRDQTNFDSIVNGLKTPDKIQELADKVKILNTHGTQPDEDDVDSEKTLDFAVNIIDKAKKFTFQVGTNLENANNLVDKFSTNNPGIDFDKIKTEQDLINIDESIKIANNFKFENTDGPGDFKKIKEDLEKIKNDDRIKNTLDTLTSKEDIGKVLEIRDNFEYLTLPKNDDLKDQIEGLSKIIANPMRLDKDLIDTTGRMNAILSYRKHLTNLRDYQGLRRREDIKTGLFESDLKTTRDLDFGIVTDVDSLKTLNAINDIVSDNSPGVLKDFKYTGVGTKDLKQLKYDLKKVNEYQKNRGGQDPYDNDRNDQIPIQLKNKEDVKNMSYLIESAPYMKKLTGNITSPDQLSETVNKLKLIFASDYYYSHAIEVSKSLTSISKIDEILNKVYA